MTRRVSPPPPPRVRPVDILTVVALMASMVILVGKGLEQEIEELRYPPVRAASGAAGAGVGGATGAPAPRPVASEAALFRLSPDELAIAPGYTPDFGAHPRTLDMYRRLRAYPGAPPRIPHGLTNEEFARSSCNTCHERGGWAARFGAFTPVTPHPEYGSCMQCHAPRDELVGTALPESEEAVVCYQCHVDPDRPPGSLVELDWRSAAWPATDVRAMPEGPHVIPHEVLSRGNCLACHGGPAAIEELRTDHPERVHCRQCHVPGAGLGEQAAAPFSPAAAVAGPAGDAVGASGSGGSG